MNYEFREVHPEREAGEYLTKKLKKKKGKGKKRKGNGGGVASAFGLSKARVRF